MQEQELIETGSSINGYTTDSCMVVIVDRCGYRAFYDRLFANVYSMQEKCVVSSYGNSSKSKTFRYVQFSQENEINVAFDLEPLV